MNLQAKTEGNNVIAIIDHLGGKERYHKELTVCRDKTAIWDFSHEDVSQMDLSTVILRVDNDAYDVYREAFTAHCYNDEQYDKHDISVDFSECKMHDVYVSQGNLFMTNFSSANIQRSEFIDVDLSCSNFSFSLIKDSKFSDCVIDGVCLVDATLEDVTFYNCHMLNHGEFDQAKSLKNIVLENCDLLPWHYRSFKKMANITMINCSIYR